MNFKGTLPLLILHSLDQGPGHGYRIAKQIKLQSQGVLDFKEGTLYPTLHSMEQQGLIAAYTEVENGRKRRYYRLTDEGRHMLEEERAEWERFASAVNTILQGAEA